LLLRLQGSEGSSGEEGLEVQVEKGMQYNQTITFLGEADEAVCLFNQS
jgi:hypothetical protein